MYSNLHCSFLKDVALQQTDREEIIQLAIFGVGRAGMTFSLVDIVVYAKE
jgi:hypothetical protein